MVVTISDTKVELLFAQSSSFMEKGRRCPNWVIFDFITTLEVTVNQVQFMLQFSFTLNVLPVVQSWALGLSRPVSCLMYTSNYLPRNEETILHY